MEGLLLLCLAVVGAVIIAWSMQMEKRKSGDSLLWPSNRETLGLFVGSRVVEVEVGKQWVRGRVHLYKGGLEVRALLPTRQGYPLTWSLLQHEIHWSQIVDLVETDSFVQITYGASDETHTVNLDDPGLMSVIGFLKPSLNKAVSSRRIREEDKASRRGGVIVRSLTNQRLSQLGGAREYPSGRIHHLGNTAIAIGILPNGEPIGDGPRIGYWSAVTMVATNIRDWLIRLARHNPNVHAADDETRKLMVDQVSDAVGFLAYMGQEGVGDALLACLCNLEIDTPSGSQALMASQAIIDDLNKRAVDEGKGYVTTQIPGD